MVEFLELPRELRDMIYEHYVVVQGGYVYDFASNTLKGADGKPIHYTLLLTCKTIACEMKGLALGANVLHFSTFYSDEHRTIAGRLDLIADRQANHMGHKVSDLEIHQLLPRALILPDDLWEELHETHPRFQPYLTALKEGFGGPLGWPRETNGEAPSAFRHFTRSVLKTVVRNQHRLDAEQFAHFDRVWYMQAPPRYLGSYNERLSTLEQSTNAKILGVNPALWDIPTSSEVEDMIGAMGKAVACDTFNCWHSDCGEKQSYPRKTGKHRYSAAAVAIRFLNSLPRDPRCSIRNIVLNEDRLGVAYAEAHGLGLIPHCKENPRLRIERRVDMWRTVFRSTTLEDRPYDSESGGMYDYVISQQVALWIMEALELEPAGMPPGSFSLVLDGDGMSGEAFRTVVQRDAIIQHASELLSERKVLPHLPYFTKRTKQSGVLTNWYVLEGFPQAIQNIVAGDSIVKCTFDVSHDWDLEQMAEQLIEQNKHVTDWDDWNDEVWNSDERWEREFVPESPYPSFKEIIAECTLDDYNHHWPEGVGQRTQEEMDNALRNTEFFGKCSANGEPPSLMDWK
ncbi:hypothetical protein C8035_v008819 [Colletotrichum spinosum]|uniref:Uncharacterized protein n=1 Tax=Colletotrichum spinosum TaxID=1347390 RepID=A0A4V3HSS4_9PEZI|nr:hypothetical protein C8035_v008819 [Colletotrichum spinosum]